VSVLYCEILGGRHLAKVTEWHWTILSFQACGYRKIEIPDIALDTATRIKELLPNAVLSVEILMGNFRTIGDPFLRLDEVNETYYLEAWKEPKFEAMHR